jgi:mRNA interferase RelE/StbE
MKVEYSKEFEKTARKLAGKNLNSLKVAILDVKKAKNIKELTDCKKLVGYENIYRLRIGDLRAFFLLRIERDTIEFEYLVSRGQAYSKKMEERLKRKNRID